MIAETEAAAEDGVDAVMVDVEPLPAVLDLEAAMAPGAARARVDVARATAPTSAARMPRRAAATVGPTTRSCRPTSPGASG